MKFHKRAGMGRTNSADSFWAEYKKIELADKGPRAIKLLDEALSGVEVRANYYKFSLAKARELTAMGNLQEATDLYLRLLNEAGDDLDLCVQAECLRRLAQLSLKQSIGEDPIELCRRSLRIAEQSESTDEVANSLQSLGSMLVQSGQSAEGIHYLNEALRVRPLSGPALFTLAKIHGFYGHYGLALELLDESSELPPFTTEAWKPSIDAIRAWILSSAGKHADAIPLYEVLIKRSKPFELVENHVLLSKSLISEGKIIEARDVLLKITQPQYSSDREYAHALIHLAECERILGNLDEALGYISRVDQLQSALRQVITTEYLLEQSKILGLLGRYEEAHESRQLYDRLVEKTKVDGLDEHLLLSQTLLERERRRHAENLRKNELQVLESRLSNLMNQLVRSSEELNSAIDVVNHQLTTSALSSKVLLNVKQTLKSIPKKFGPERFLIEFDLTYPSFRKSIKQEFPKITTMQMIISCTIKVHLSVPDSARLLSLSERNIENHRYRLRKLFGLKREESLSDFLQKF